NFCLGRITKYLQEIKGYRFENALAKVTEWNRRCTPPKSVSEVTSDFETYWKSDYKLLGCQLNNLADRSILERYCEKYNCTMICEENSENKISELEVKMDNHILQNKVLHKMRGNHYLILSVLHIHANGLTIQKLSDEITNSYTGKCCLSRNTLKSVLQDLTG
ncbi:MAG: hypothetical protein RR654_11255, partial [Oscillospiraceae bacterium]